jgi:signal transduction histidine kinase
VQIGRQSIALLGIVTAVAIALSLLSFQYSNYISSQALAISAQDVRTNSEITAHDLSRVFVNKVENVKDNLQIIAQSPAVKEQNMDRAKQFFDTAYESTHEITDSYFWVDREGILLWANAFSNETIYQQYKGGDRSQRSYYLEPRQTHEPYVSAVIESVDGVPRVYISYPVFDNQGSFNGVVVAASNLEAIGQFLNGELSPKLESTIGMTDGKGTVLFSQTQSIIGKDVFGPETQSILPDEMKDTFNSIVRDALAGNAGSGDFTYQGTTTTIAYESLTFNGKEFGVLYVLTPHTLAGSTVALIEQQRNLATITTLVIGATAIAIAYVILSWNKTLKQTVAQRTEELRQSNESLKTAVEQLQGHDKLQQEFINIAAHELRTPIQPLIGIVEMMRLTMQEEDKKHVQLSEEEIAMLERNARRLEKLTKNILDVTRIEGNRLSLEKEKFDMNQKVKNVINDTARIVNNQDGKIVAVPIDRYAGDAVPVIEFSPLSSALIVDADKTRLFEVLSNLLRNAIKFTKQGKIEIKAYRRDREVIVEIKDSGKGIHPEVMPKLFTKFITKSETGTGLGLYISKSIVEAHGGKMWARNNSDSEGATFYFSIPLAEDSSVSSVNPEDGKN